jgi:hypothetical protein
MVIDRESSVLLMHKLFNQVFPDFQPGLLVKMTDVSGTISVPITEICYTNGDRDSPEN